MDILPLTLYGFPDPSHYEDPTSPNRVEWLAITEQSAVKRRRLPIYQKYPGFNFAKYTKDIRALGVISHVEFPDLGHFYLVVGADYRGILSYYSFFCWRELELPSLNEDQRRLSHSLISNPPTRNEIPLEFLSEMESFCYWDRSIFSVDREGSTYANRLQLTLFLPGDRQVTFHVVDCISPKKNDYFFLRDKTEALAQQAKFLFIHRALAEKPTRCRRCGAEYLEPGRVAVSPYWCESCSPLLTKSLSSSR